MLYTQNAAFMLMSLVDMLQGNTVLDIFWTMITGCYGHKCSIYYNVKLEWAVLIMSSLDVIHTNAAFMLMSSVDLLQRNTVLDFFVQWSLDVRVTNAAFIVM